MHINAGNEPNSGVLEATLFHSVESLARRLNAKPCHVTSEITENLSAHKWQKVLQQRCRSIFWLPD
jgi:hypothetical protein